MPYVIEAFWQTAGLTAIVQVRDLNQTQFILGVIPVGYLAAYVLVIVGNGGFQLNGFNVRQIVLQLLSVSANVLWVTRH
jgi:hypothetical protein